MIECAAENKLTINEMKGSGKAYKNGGSVAKTEPTKPAENLVKRRGRKPGSKGKKSQERGNQNSTASGAVPTGMPPVNHLKQFRLAFEFLRANSERDLKRDPSESICLPVLSQAVFTDCMPCPLKALIIPFIRVMMCLRVNYTMIM